MLPKFEQFIRERQYLTNVSPATLEWYKHSLKWLRTESPAEGELKGAVVRMREKGLKATGLQFRHPRHQCLSALEHCGRGRKMQSRVQAPPHPAIERASANTAHVHHGYRSTRLVNWKPRAKIFWQRRLHLLILFLLDTGCRVEEALSIRVREIDFDNLLLTLDGKGGQAAGCSVFL